MWCKVHGIKVINCGNVHGSHLGLIPGQRAEYTFRGTPWLKVGLETIRENYENDHTESFSTHCKLNVLS